MKTPSGPPADVDETLAWAPWLFDWQAHGGSRYDYFIVKASANVGAPIFKDRFDSVELIAQADTWWLYRNLTKIRQESPAAGSLIHEYGDPRGLPR